MKDDLAGLGVCGDFELGFARGTTSRRPWTLTASLYSGARWAGGVVESTPGAVAMQPVTTTRKVATTGVLVGLLALASSCWR